MIGMHLFKTRGGITTLAQDILRSKLGDDYEITYIASQAEDLGRVGKFFLAIRAGFRFLGTSIKRADLAYVHVGSNASLYRESAFIVLAKCLGSKVICHFHAGDLAQYMTKQNRLGRKFISWALSFSDRFIAVSQESAHDLRKMLPSANLTVLPNAIDLNDFRTFDRKGNGAVRVLFVGSADKLKGEKDLVAALTLLRDKDVRVKASFLGYGTERLAKECEASGIGHMIDHLGPVATAKRVEFYQKADIFVLPTYAEAMPISVIEAMAAGLPVITTPVGGIPELIDDGTEGLFFACGDIPGLAGRIMQLADDEVGRRKMGELARKRIMVQLNFDKYVERLGNEIELVRSIGGSK